MFSNERGYLGRDGFIWFHGVVEDVNDPKQLGRARVRILGDHTQDKDKIPTEHLPWSYVVMPVNNASMNGIGDSPLGVVNGTWVVGFYRDGPNKQQPVIFGTIGGIPEVPPDASIGFNDPNECFPMKDRLEEPDTNRLARGESGGEYSMPHPVTEERRNMVIAGLPTCNGSWSEPDVPYNAEYPYNKVWEGWWNKDCYGQDWGHVEEWDSTPENERYLRWHKSSKNFIEIHPDGKEVRKIHGDNFELDLMSKHLLIKGDYKITVEGNRDELIKGDYCLHVMGNYTQTVDGYKDETISLYKKEWIGGFKNQTIIGFYAKMVGGYDTETIGLYKKSNITGAETKLVGMARSKTVIGEDATFCESNIIRESDENISISADGDISVDAVGNIDRTAGGVITDTAIAINLIGLLSIQDEALFQSDVTFQSGAIFQSTVSATNYVDFDGTDVMAVIGL